MSIQTSIGTPTATSYVSVNSADAYLNARQNSDAWTNISLEASTSTLATASKENLLKQATRELDFSYRYHDSKYNQGIKGETTYQNLEFPRSTNFNSDSELIIPDEVQNATCEQALWIMERSGVKPDTEGSIFARQLVGVDAYNYIDQWVNRQVTSQNKPSWK